MANDKQSKVYHNTSLLLKSYKDLKEHCSGCESLVKIENDAFEDWANIENVTTTFEDYLKSVKKTKTKTMAMLQLVDRYLKVYKQQAKKKHDDFKMKRYELINLKYISDDLSLRQIAERFSVDASTIGKWHKKAINELSVLFFGVEAVRLENLDE